MRLKGIIFDLDGTLGNTLPVCFAAYRSAFAQFLGRTYTDREITALFGPSEEGIIQKLVPHQWQACLQTYLGIYEQVHARYAVPFPGLEDALRLLRQRGVVLAVVTGKGTHSAAISLRYLDLAGYFDIVETGSASGAIKPRSIRKVLAKWQVPPHEVAYVGDTAYDLKAALEAHVIPLGAAWAATAEVNSLKALAPLAVFDRVEDFMRWIDHNL